MAYIELETPINAPKEICFDLSRNIDLHTSSLSHTDEQAVGGITTGLIELSQSVTWKARHFGIIMFLTSKITEFEYPSKFTDEMVEGPFKFIKHEHIFSSDDDGTLMTDKFTFESPFGILGKAINIIFLKKYMTSLLIQRNRAIKKVAENEYSNKLI